MTTLKLAEVALPLAAINRESAREKSPRKGHPSGLHIWWSRKPLASCRAMTFALLVDDPCARPDWFPTVEEQDAERDRLFEILERLVLWESTTDASVIHVARREIARSLAREVLDRRPADPTAQAMVDGEPSEDEVVAFLRREGPVVEDPFCGGGSIPLEAARLGLRTRAYDLNPVASLITRALVELPQHASDIPSLHPGSDGPAPHLAADVLHYGRWVLAEAQRRIADYFPEVELSEGGMAPVVAWLWARTVTCPNPSCRATLPLVGSFWLRKRRGPTWLEPIVEGMEIRFEVRSGDGSPQAGTIGRGGVRCLVCANATDLDFVRETGRAGEMGSRLMALVVAGPKGKVFLPADEADQELARAAQPAWVPETDLPDVALGFRVQNYGITKHSQLYTSRQLLTLTTFNDLVRGAHARAWKDAEDAGRADGAALRGGGSGAIAYADFIATFIGLAVSKMADLHNAHCSWEFTNGKISHLFTRQAIPMVWNYLETNPFGGSSGDFFRTLERVVDVLRVAVPGGSGAATQADAAELPASSHDRLFLTDPPYYDNIGYADLSDFFYVWLRPALRYVHPDLFRTMLVPKAGELIMAPYRFGGDRATAATFFGDRLGKVLARMREDESPAHPLGIFYAFREAAAGKDGVATAWESILSSVVEAKLRITGTWPLRTEMPNRTRSLGSNALASSILLVCRPRAADAGVVSRGDFVRELRAELPHAVQALLACNVAPVDLAQAVIGPGMAIFSRHERVLESDGNAMTVRTALGLINRSLDGFLAPQDAELDPVSLFAASWYEAYGMEVAAYGDAETLAKARNVSVQEVQRAGVVEAGGGRVKLVARLDMSPTTGAKAPPTWSVLQAVVLALETEGEESAAMALAGVNNPTRVRDLAYRLHAVAQRKAWAAEATSYNGLVSVWPELSRLMGPTAR